MQPIDQMSTDFPYYLIFNSNYGDRYHNVTTFLVNGLKGFSTILNKRHYQIIELIRNQLFLKFPAYSKVDLLILSHGELYI